MIDISKVRALVSAAEALTAGRGILSVSASDSGFRVLLGFERFAELFLGRDVLDECGHYAIEMNGVTYTAFDKNSPSIRARTVRL